MSIKKPEPEQKRKRGNPKLKKGEQPAWLKGKDFLAHPEHINRYGTPSDVTTLKKMILQMGNEAIELEDPKTKQRVILTRFERILFDWFNSQSFDKQQAIMQYGIGKIRDEVKVTGELKVIKVGIKKREDNADTDS